MKTKKALTAVTACALSFTMAFAFTACNNDNEDETPVITAIALSQAEEVEAGSTVNVIQSVTYSDGSTKKSDSSINWVTSNEAVATVNRGIVSAKAAGEATITATAGSVTSNACKVTVIPSRVVTIYDSQGNAVDALSLDVATNKTATLSAKVTREGVELENQEIEWSSANSTVISVNQSGLVTAVQDTESGPVNVIATIKGTSIRAEVPVTATWTGKEDLTFDASTYEQNKSPAGIWNYWGDKNYNWTNTEIGATYVDPTYEEEHEADTANGFFYIGANKVTTNFSIADPTKNVASVQLFYRSAGDSEAAKLKTNYNYELKLKIKSSAAGTVSLNDYTVVKDDGNGHLPDPRTEAGEICTDEEYEFEVEANKETTLTVKFRHGDSGAIYAQGIYNNIESAIQLCLGKIGAADELVTVEVYDIQYKELGAAEKLFYDNEENLEGYVKPVELPDMGDAESINFALDATNKDPGETGSLETEYNITAGADGKSSTVAYKSYTSTYEALYIDISENETANSSNTFAVTVKNNNDADMNIRFDLNGTEATGDNNVKNCVLSFVTSSNGSGKVDAYGGTSLTVKANEEVTVYYTYSTENHGTLDKIAVYFDSLWWDDSEPWAGKKAERTGNVTISDLKFANVVDITKSATANDVEIVKEGEAVYFVVTGTCKNYTLDELKEVELWLQSSDWDTNKDVKAVEADLSVTLDNGSYEFKWNITNLAAGSYMGHLTPAFLGTEFGDLMHESALDAAISCNGKTYDYVEVSFGNWSRYCLTVTAE